MEKGEIRINTENIFPIIKKAVYSDQEIFLRELVSNGVDAISKRRMASMAGDCENTEEAKVKISINREKNTLTISDNGIGMNDEEIKKYINQVAFSSAEEFLTKYKKDNDEFIGHFGLGFYSSFMVADRVDILTKSAIGESKAFKWSCDGSPNFTLEESERETIGTDVILHLLEEEKEFIEPERIKSLIKKYCDFMPIDVLLEGETINKKNPPWRKQPSELKDEDYIELYKYLYPFQGDPLLWIHLNTDYPYDIQGILYFPKLSGRADWEKGEIKLFCNQVFVSDSIKEIVPKYLLPLRGVIDSTDIPLNVSRSALQTDRKVRSISSFISKKIANKLKDLIKSSPEFYAEIWDSISAFIKIGAIEDEKIAELKFSFGEFLKDKEIINKSPYLIYVYAFLILFGFGFGIGFLRNNLKKSIQDEVITEKPLIAIDKNQKISEKKIIQEIKKNPSSKLNTIPGKSTSIISNEFKELNTPSPSLEDISNLINGWLISKRNYLAGKSEINLSKIVSKGLIDRTIEERQNDIKKGIYKEINSQIRKIDLESQTSSRIVVLVELNYLERLVKNSGEFINETSLNPLKVKYI